MRQRDVFLREHFKVCSFNRTFHFFLFIFMKVSPPSNASCVRPLSSNSPSTVLTFPSPLLAGPRQLSPWLPAGITPDRETDAAPEAGARERAREREVRMWVEGGGSGLGGDED